MQIKIYIDGMACVHCKNGVEKALKELKNVEDAVVDLEQKCATVDINGEIDQNTLIDAVTVLGFDVEKII